MNRVRKALMVGLLVWTGVSVAQDTGHGHDHATGGVLPTEPGESVFATVQEIVALLEADPRTDWSRVDIDALRTHLIDMDLAATRAVVRREPLPGGLRLTIGGDARTLAAVGRMVPAHAAFMDGTRGWRFESGRSAEGVVLTVTGDDDADAVRIRALGYMGLLAMGGHHQAHHLALATGAPVH